MKRYTTAIKSGRAFNGFHKDSGTIVHLVEPLPPNCSGDWFTKSLCGIEPGRCGNGWSEVAGVVTCPKCGNNPVDVFTSAKEDYVYDGDNVECFECGLLGCISVDEDDDGQGIAHTIWDDYEDED